MAIDRTAYNALVDDDGSNLVGTVWTKNIVKTVLLDPIDVSLAALDTVDTTKAPLASPALTGTPTAPTAAAATNTTQLATTAFVMANGGGSVDVGVCEGRLTLTTGVPVTTADVTGATTIYWTPYKGKYIALYNGSTAWTLLAFAETSLALGTLTAALPYDLFAWNNGGTLALELLAWTSATARATALVLQDGVLVKSGATTRRYLGTFCTTTTTTTEDSQVKRYVWNYYNRTLRPMKRLESASSWTYASAAWRQANANTLNQLAWVTGVDEQPVSVAVVTVAANPTGNTLLGGAIGLDSVGGPTSAQSVTFYSQVANVNIENVCLLTVFAGIGAHYAAWLDYSGAGTTTYQGNSVNAGMSAQVWG